MNIDVFCRSLGATIRKSRKQRSLSQGQLAMLAGVSERTVRAIEQGKSPGISLHRLSAVMDCLGLELAFSEGCASNPTQSTGAFSTVEYSKLLQQAVASWGGEGWLREDKPESAVQP